MAFLPEKRQLDGVDGRDKPGHDKSLLLAAGIIAAEFGDERRRPRGSVLFPKRRDGQAAKPASRRRAESAPLTVSPLRKVSHP